MSKCWVYHETEEPKIVNASETQDYYDDGWKDSPRYFVKTTDFGVDPDDSLAVQNLGETIEGVADALNGALNIDVMEKPELVEYAATHFGVTLGARKRIATLRAEVKTLIEEGKDGDSE